MSIFNKIIDEETSCSYPLEIELLFQFFEREYQLNRYDVCKKLGIQTPEEKYGTKVKRENGGEKLLSEEESIKFRKKRSGHNNTLLDKKNT